MLMPFASEVAAPRISVITISWNAWPDLERCLRSIRASSVSGLEILVGENGSSDGTPEELSKAFPEVRIHQNGRNLGHGPALNREFALARGAYILVLDSDTELEPDTLGILVDFMESHPEAALAAPRILAPDGTIEESARAFPNAMNGIFGRQSLLTRLAPNNRFSQRYLARAEIGQTEPFLVDQVSAACMLFRRELLDETGPWDEEFKAYWVDTDWCMRLRDLGKKVFCVPQARIIHYEQNRRGRRKSAFRIWAFHEGAYRLYRKHFTAGRLDPRAILAFMALSLRALLLIVAHSAILPLLGDRGRGTTHEVSP
jgi:GT2 family glycosyltransferase